MTTRPRLGIAGSGSADAIAAVEEFATGLQAGHDLHDADVLNRQFADDVAWGSPYGALIDGYEQLHPIHARFQRRGDEAPVAVARYEVRNVRAISDDVVIAHIARLVLDEDGTPVEPSHDPGRPFSELAMYVLVRREGQWWLAAGQNTPMRPGGAAPAQIASER